MEYIDKIIYINLQKRTDRKNTIEKELDNFKLKYQRFEAIETPGFGILGCGLSHLSVLKFAKEKNYKNILILEDDFTFIVSKEEFENQIKSFFSLQIGFDVCMLSYNLFHSIETDNKFVGKILEAQTASGYIVNNHYFDKLIYLYEDAMPKLKETKCHWIYANDQIWKQLQKKDAWYYFKVRLGKQINGFSDNANDYVNYNC
jgi:glycosyl transferase family 25